MRELKNEPWRPCASVCFVFGTHLILFQMFVNCKQAWGLEPLHVGVSRVYLNVVARILQKENA